MNPTEFEAYLDHMCRIMGLTSRDEAASEILRWWDAYPVATRDLAEAYLSAEVSSGSAL